jgi:hypothetical protein
MNKFQQENPDVAAKIMNYMESGLTPADIVQELQLDSTKKLYAHEKEPEIIPESIKMISQALAYRIPDDSDIKVLVSLLSAAYEQEVNGEEAFREAPSVAEEVVVGLLNDSSYHWLLAEAPNGRGVEADGLIMGACCYSTNGVSKKNGNKSLSPPIII